jgi:hypothetical protein
VFVFVDGVATADFGSTDRGFDSAAVVGAFVLVFDVVAVCISFGGNSIFGGASGSMAGVVGCGPFVAKSREISDR